jgi:hypothetical protein
MFFLECLKLQLTTAFRKAQTGNQNSKTAYNKKINPTGDKPVLIFQ